MAFYTPTNWKVLIVKTWDKSFKLEQVPHECFLWSCAYHEAHWCTKKIHWFITVVNLSTLSIPIWSTSHLVNSHLVNSHFANSHFVNSYFVNSHLVNVDQMGIDRIPVVILDLERSHLTIHMEDTRIGFMTASLVDLSLSYIIITIVQ